jgi:deoxycytidylate deaminase
MNNLPYLPSGKNILYCSQKNEFMKKAKEISQENNNAKQQVGVVIVSNGKIISKGNNNSFFHGKFGCLRKLFNVSTGKKYWLCPGCNDKSHAEAQAINNTQKEKISLENCDLYLYGHWWCCEHCWEKIIKAGIKDVYLLENSTKLFKR